MKTHLVAKAVLVTSEGKMLRIRRSETDDRRPLEWDIPGGMVEEGEDFAAATVREIEEETGIEVDPKHLDLAYTTTHIKSYKGDDLNVIWLIFVARVEEQDIKLSFEHDKGEWVDFDTAISDWKYPLQQDALKHIRDNDLIEDLPL